MTIPTESDQSNRGYTPLLSAQLWSDPIGARQLRAKVFRHRTSQT